MTSKTCIKLQDKTKISNQFSLEFEKITIITWKTIVTDDEENDNLYNTVMQHTPLQRCLDTPDTQRKSET